MRVLDLCTGSGCIAWSVALSVPGTEVVGVDISEPALAVARSQDFARECKERKAKAPLFVCADVLDTEQDFDHGTFDLILSNPPYITESEKDRMHRNVLEHEPHLALFVPDGDPLVFYRAVAAWSRRFLAEEGRGMAEINECRSDKLDNSTAGMEMFTKLPRWLMRIVMWGLHRLDFYGRVPYDLIKADPNYASVFITNLGSIKLNAAYHHLSNWGTNSVFVIIGEKGRKPVFHEDGTFEMHSMLSVGITLDERIADGYYYAQTIRLVKKLIECPELLDLPANARVDY